MNVDHRPYYRFSDYLKEQFGTRVHKVTVDAGFSCPNRDGSKSSEGCIFCDNRGFSFNVRMPNKSIHDQIKNGVEAGIHKYNAEKFIVYFQAHTNTYAPINELKEKYDIVRSFYNIAGIAIGTRPDCVSEEVLDVICGYSKDFEMWLEFGLQSIHDNTLKCINRGHDYSEFLGAYRRTKDRRNIKVCVHVILGLPGETKEDMIETAKALARLKIDAIKIHPLHIVRGTKLDAMHKDGQYKMMSLNEYVDYASYFLAHLWPQTIIQRISADCAKEFLVGPEWIKDKNTVLQNIESTLNSKGMFQGSLYKD